jgi:hypothetical protein
MLNTSYEIRLPAAPASNDKKEVKITPVTLNGILRDPNIREISNEKLTNLICASKAESSGSIEEYAENGAKISNADLRKIATENSHKISGDSALLLKDLRAQNNCEATIAFRLHYAKPECVQLLTTPGTLVADFGVTSANIHLKNAEDWLLSHPDDATEKIIIVLGPNVPKKNISIGFLMDHVAVLPGEVLKVSDCVKEGGLIYVLLEEANDSPPHEPVYSPFDGTAYSDFYAKKAALSLM